MKNAGELKVTAAGDREIIMTRVFNAPREMVFDAWTKPELVRRWLLGPDGWSMPVCEIDARPGGRYRYVWKNDVNGSEMGMSGTYIEVKRPDRIVSTETFDEAWYPGEGRNTLVLVENNGETTMTATSRYESRAARDAVLRTGMESGVRASYDRLAAILESSEITTSGASR
ncbi:MAG TPA: SRPBCC family protein [Gemmatimonadaceae bacterium]|nr:SRPBCC family protein [Gemmatimonadaceae bacterium]